MPFSDTVIDDMLSATEPIATATTSVARIRPEAFLAAHPQTPRGFWTHGDSWTAYAGAALVVRADPGAARFGAVRDAAGERLSDATDRMYGGFAFRDAPGSVEEWAPFGAGAFVLPAVEARVEGDVHTLICRAGSVSAADQALRTARARLASLADPVAGRSGAAAITPIADARSAWGRGIDAILRAVAAGDMIKVVLARALDVETRADPLDVLSRLLQDNPASTVFYVEPTPGAALVGAAPEIVVELQGRKFRTTAVAGSIARGRNAAEDERLARELMDSAKDRAEHAIGVQETLVRLAPFAAEVNVQPVPHVLRLSRIQHLETHLATAVERGTHVLDLLDALHPTAAVCGSPRERVLDFLSTVEPFERGWYAGPVGWFDGAGNGAFAPALRSGVRHSGRWRLYAGAGIVAGSDASREWDETRMKFEPMLRALEAAPTE